MVCRSALRTLLQRSFAHAATDRDDAGVGRQPDAPAGDPHDAPAPPQWAEGWNIAKPDVVLPMPKPVTIPADGDVEYTYEIVPTHFTEDKWIQMAEVHPSSPQYVHHAVVYIRPPDSRLVAACADRGAVHGFDAERSAGPSGSARNYQRLVAGVRARQFAGPMAGWNGKVRSGGIGPGFPDPLHHQRHGGQRPDQHRPGVRQGATAAARHHSAAQRSRLHHSARRGRFSGRSAGHAAARRHSAQPVSAHASARKTFRVRHRAARWLDRDRCCA